MPVYATTTQFYLSGLPAEVCARAETKAPGCVARALEVASGMMDAYFRTAYGVEGLPLLTWDDEVVRRCCHLATMEVLGVLGPNPMGSDEWYILRHKEAVTWLKDVAGKRVYPAVGVAVAPTPATDGPVVLSPPPRGWDPCVTIEESRCWGDPWT